MLETMLCYAVIDKGVHSKPSPQVNKYTCVILKDGLFGLFGKFSNTVSKLKIEGVEV